MPRWLGRETVEAQIRALQELLRIGCTWDQAMAFVTSSEREWVR